MLKKDQHTAHLCKNYLSVASTPQTGKKAEKVGEESWQTSEQEAVKVHSVFTPRFNTEHKQNIFKAIRVIKVWLDKKEEKRNQ